MELLYFKKAFLSKLIYLSLFLKINQTVLDFIIKIQFISQQKTVYLFYLKAKMVA